MNKEGYWKKSELKIIDKEAVGGGKCQGKRENTQNIRGGMSNSYS